MMSNPFGQRIPREEADPTALQDAGAPKDWKAIRKRQARSECFLRITKRFSQTDQWNLIGLASDDPAIIARNEWRDANRDAKRVIDQYIDTLNAEEAKLFDVASWPGWPR